MLRRPFVPGYSLLVEVVGRHFTHASGVRLAVICLCLAKDVVVVSKVADLHMVEHAHIRVGVDEDGRKRVRYKFSDFLYIFNHSRGEGHAGLSRPRKSNNGVHSHQFLYMGADETRYES